MCNPIPDFIQERIFDFVTEKLVVAWKKYASNPVDYVVNNKKKLKELEKAINDLQEDRNRVYEKAEEDEVRFGREVYHVKAWLRQVKDIVHEHDKLKQGRQKHFVASFLNPIQRYVWSKTAQEIKGTVGELQNEKCDIIISSWQDLSSIGVVTSEFDYIPLRSRETTKKKIKESLEDPNARLIGVFGATGVGKTTLVKSATALLEKTNNKFDVVITVKVTKCPDIKRIQGQIADMLGVKLEGESEHARAITIQEKLKNEKDNILIILDDLCAKIDLNSLGIPSPTDDLGPLLLTKGESSADKQTDGADKERETSTQDNSQRAHTETNKQKAHTKTISNGYRKLKTEEGSRGYKILLISDLRQVLTEMDVKLELIIHVKLLNRKDGETLFKEMAGIGANNSEIETLAAEIANKCQGLPMSIITTARALKNQSHLVWKDTHRALEKLEEENQLAAPEYSTKLSYRLLENEELKLTFLLCAHMDHDALVADLVRYCIGLGFLQGVYSVWEARDRVQMLLVKLKDAGLLSNSYSSNHFTMQNLVRNAALSISSEERRVFTMTEGKFNEWPTKDELESCTVISLRHCDFIRRFPKSIKCPRLSVFHIENNGPCLEIPDSFFQEMEELRVLILVGVNLSRLPSSIKCLTKLRMLRLEQCILGEQLEIIGELENLRILSFSGSDVKSLPDELKHLSNLQIFDISNCYKLRVIPNDVMKSLTRLEELYVRNTCIQWQADNDKQEVQSVKASLSVLQDLNQLTNLDLQIPSAEHLPKNFFFDKLYSYKILIGSSNRYLEADFMIPDKYELSRCLAICQKDDGFDIHSQEGIKLLLERVEILLLEKLNGVQDVLYELNLKGFPYLKRLSIASNKSIHFLISQKMKHFKEVFPKLESLYLYKLRKMEQIFSCQPLSEGSFGNLKVIKIKLCGCLKNVFLMSMVGLLIALETIEISECHSLETIVGETNNHNETEPTLKFLKLRSLTLQSLSKFIGFYPISSEEDTGSLFDGKIEVPELERIELSMLQIKHIWSDQILAGYTVDQRTSPPFHQKLTTCFGKKHHTIKQTYSSFQNLMHLHVNGCWNLESLWSFSIARHLVNLQSLFVTDCEMTNIFPQDQGDGDAKMKKDAIFPNLKTVKLSSMKSLCKIWNSDEAPENSFGKLSTLIIDTCDELVNVIPHNMAPRLSSLSCLRVMNCASIQVIFKEADDDDKKQDAMHNIKLQDIHLEALPKLENVFKWEKEVKWSDLKLQKIWVHDCGRLENIFSVSVVKNVEIKIESLESFVVSDCYQLREIVGKGKDAVINSSSPIQFEFPKLTTVKFFGLSKFKSFYSAGAYELSCPTLKDLSIESCDLLELFEETSSHAEIKNALFPENSKIGEGEGEGEVKVKEVINNKLKSMHIESRHLVGSSMDYDYRRDSLEELQLSGLNNSDIIYSFLHCNPNLKSLCLNHCMFKELKPGGTRWSAIGVVPKLKTLTLTNMYDLEMICFEQDAVFQKIESLVIRNCTWLPAVAPSSVSLAHLTILEVVDCWKLIYVMSTSTAKSLGRLKTMKVINCENLEEIVLEETQEEENSESLEEEKTQEGQEEKENVGTEVPIIFKQLTTLELVSLESLNSFCSSKNCAFKFPSLENFIVSACPNMKNFSKKKVECGPNLQKIYYVHDKEKKRWGWHEDNIESTIRYIFDNKKFFEGMNVLPVSDYGKYLKPIWRSKGSLRKDWFFGLKTLRLYDWDASNRHAIPSNVLCCLKSLQELQVVSCYNIESIFEMDDTKSWESSFQLKKLTLEHLKYLKSVWQHDKGEILLGFQNLQQVTIRSCERLTSVFPTVLARDLKKLEELHVSYCDELQEIVGKDEEEAVEGSQKFVFPRLTELRLSWLPQLNDFKTGRLTLECPELKQLQLFLKQHQKYPEGGFSKVEKLWLDPRCTWSKEFMNQGGFHQYLNELYLWYSVYNDHGVNSTSPFEILADKMLPKLEIIKIYGNIHCKTMNIPKEAGERMLHLKELKLDSLNGLNSISGLEYLLKLRLLKVSRCHNLTTGLVLHSYSNLKELDITGCDGLECLLTFSAVKMLIHLEELKVDQCHSLKEIVQQESGTEDIIEFKHLHRITLADLGRLECFYSGNATLQFPSLIRLDIIGCFEMKFFSQTEIHVKPPLFQVFYSDDEADRLFLHDLNVAVACQFLRQQIYLDLGDHPELKDLWLDKVHIPAEAYSSGVRLERLRVKGCNEFFTTAIFPSHLLPFLSRLEKLEVQGCNSVEAIYEIKDTTANIVIPLKKLTLEKLPTLRHVWNKDTEGKLSLPKLEEVIVDECASIKSVFPESVGKGNIQSLEVKNCAELVEIVTGDDVAKQVSIFSTLCCLKLVNLPNLECPLLSQLLPSLHKLEELVVEKCSSLKTIFDVKDVPTNEEDTNMITVIPLKKLTLEKLPTLSHVWKGKLSLPKLEEVIVDECGSLKSLFLESVNIQRLEVKNCEKLVEIVTRDELVKEEDADKQVNIFSKLSCLKLWNLPNLSYIYHGMKDSEFSLSNALLPWHMLPSLHKLEELVVGNCGSFETIFDVKDAPTNKEDTNMITVIPLEKLILEHLPTLSHIWNKDSKGSSLSFLCLEKVVVNGCKRLTSLFPASVPMSNIKNLDVRNCEELVEIVTKDETDNEETTNKEFIMFPEIMSLTLHNLPNLTYIYAGMQNLNWPELIEFDVSHCNLIKKFTDSAAKVVTPHLERLSIDKAGVMMLDKELLHLDPQNITYLRLQGFNDSDAASAFDFFPKVPLPNIKRLGVADSACKEIFPSKKPEIIHSQLLAQELELRNLHKLESIGLDHTWVTFSNLTSLKLEGCASLKCLFTSSTSKCLDQLEELHISNCETLENLMVDYQPHDNDHDVIIFKSLSELSLSQLPKLESFYKGNSTLNFPSLWMVEVTECNRLEYIFTFSTAKSFESLNQMRISKCESLETVVLATQEADEPHELTFPDVLWYLLLSELPKLGSFFTGKSTLKFQESLSVEISQCKIMKTFSHGGVEAPNLDEVEIDGVSCSTDNLNVAVSQEFEKRTKQH